MAQFTGTLRIEGERGSPLPVKAEISDNLLVLTTDGSDLGSWPLNKLQPQARGAGVGLMLDGDPVVIDVGNADRFYEAVVGKAAKPGKNGRRAKSRSRAQATAEVTPAAESPKAARQLPSMRVVVAAVLILAMVVAAWVAPDLVGAVSLFLGLVLVIVASGAVVDSRVALKLPFGLEAMHVMILGVGVLLIGVILTFLG